jgi:hypothetical protein
MTIIQKLVLVVASMTAALLVAATIPAFRAPPAHPEVTQAGADGNRLSVMLSNLLRSAPPAEANSAVRVTNQFPAIRNTLASCELTLTKAQPFDPCLRATLVEVASDGTTTLRADTGRTLKARVGEYFASEEYGRAGLRLVSASGERQEALLERTWCETTRE